MPVREAEVGLVLAFHVWAPKAQHQTTCVFAFGRDVKTHLTIRVMRKFLSCQNVNKNDSKFKPGFVTSY